MNCTCDAGFEGKECEFEINFCENVTCKNNGNCSTNKARTGFHCNCDNGKNFDIILQLFLMDGDKRDC